MKKNIIVAALMLFSLVACAQKEEFAVIYTTINGELIEIAEKELVQSHTLENGKGKIVLKPDVTEIPQDLLIWGDDIITNVDVPKGIISIGNRAFRGFENLTGITISEGVKSIDAQAFWDCLELSIIYVRAKNPPILNMSDDWRYPFYYPSITKIYVPQESLETYHYDEGWSNYWDKIEGYNFE